MAAPAPRPLRAPALQLDVQVTVSEAERLQSIFSSKSLDLRTANVFVRDALPGLLSRVMNATAAKVPKAEAILFLHFLPLCVTRYSIENSFEHFNPPPAARDTDGAAVAAILANVPPHREELPGLMWNLLRPILPLQLYKRDPPLLRVRHESWNVVRVFVQYASNPTSEELVARIVWHLPPPRERPIARVLY